MEKRRYTFNVEYLLWLALILALAGSLKHLASVFASVDGNTFLGWLQAIAIDAGVFALAYQIRIRRKERRNTKRLWFGVATFTGISVYGNLAYGLQAVNNALPHWIQVSRPYVLAATLPVLVLFLAELLGDDREYAKTQAQPVKRERSQEKADGPTRKSAKTSTRIPKVEWRETAATLLEENPQITGTELAQRIGASKRTGQNILRELSPNGNGKER